MNPLRPGSTVRIAVRSGNVGKILYATVLAVGAAFAENVGANSEPPLSLAYLDIDGDPRKLSGPVWADAFKREVGVHHATAKAPVAGHVSIVWIDVLPIAGQELCGDDPSGPELPELDVFDYFPDLNSNAVATSAPSASPLPPPAPVPAQTQPQIPEPQAAQIAVIQGVVGEQSVDGIVHVQATGGERVNRKIGALAPGNILPDLKLIVEAVTQAKDGKLYVATSPFGSISDGKDWTETGDGTDYPKQEASSGSTSSDSGPTTDGDHGTEDGKPSAADLDAADAEQKTKEATTTNEGEGQAQTSV